MNTLEYYDDNYIKIFDSVENPQWRIWKSIDEDGICRQSKFQINSPEKLLKFIKLCKNPKALYVSISTFLNPHKNHGFFANQKIYTKEGYFYPREGYLTADCIMLDSYFFLDLDSEKDLRIAQSDARKIINKLKHNTQLKLYNTQFSGKKGVHLIYKFKKRNIKDPIKRIYYYQNQKALILNQLSKLNLKTMDKFHNEISKDIFRVYAVPYSIKSDGGIVMPIQIDDFINKDIYSLISVQKVREAKANDKKVAPGEFSSPSTVSGKERADLSSCQSFKFMDNMINGLKNNYVTVIKKKENKFSIKLLKNLQKTYQLSHFYIERIGNDIYAYNTKALQFKRLCKVLRAAKSDNMRWFQTRRHLPIHMSYPVEREFLGYLDSDYGKDDDHSMSHSRLFRLKYVNEVGNPNRTGVMKIHNGIPNS